MTACPRHQQAQPQERNEKVGRALGQEGQSRQHAGGQEPPVTPLSIVIPNGVRNLTPQMQEQCQRREDHQHAEQRIHVYHLGDGDVERVQRQQSRPGPRHRLTEQLSQQPPDHKHSQGDRQRQGQDTDGHLGAKSAARDVQRVRWRGPQRFEQCVVRVLRRPDQDHRRHTGVLGDHGVGPLPVEHGVYEAETSLIPL